MADRQVDVAVIGGGPGGCTFAILAAQAGLNVVVLERESFPRHMIGESLLPNNTPLFKRLGLFDAIESGGYQKKPGAVFTHEPTEYSRKIRFRDAYQCQAPYAYQVERASFDRMFIDRAREVGATVIQPAQVVDVLGDVNEVRGVCYRDGEGTHKINARFTVDASGRSICLAKKLSRIDRDPVLNQSCAYAYFDKFQFSPIAENGDIEILQTEDAWVWLIPLSQELVSVGAVWTKEHIKQQKSDLPSMYRDLVKRSTVLASRLQDANQVGEIRSVADYSYKIDPAWGKGWLCIGDAAVFVDPVFSSGVMLSTLSAERAFDLTVDQLKSGKVPTLDRLRRYQNWISRGLQRFKFYIYGYYTPGFQKVFYSDPPLRAFRRAVASNLAGNVFDPSLATRFWTSLFWFNVRRENRKLGYKSSFAGLS